MTTHHAQAAQLLAMADNEGEPAVRDGWRRAAQVHATLALADATLEASRRIADAIADGQVNPSMM